jgi:hypothetical protein
MKSQIRLFFALSLFTFSTVHATEWEPLNSEKKQTLEQHCSVVSLLAGVVMQARQIGVPMDALMDGSSRPVDREILISAFEQPKMIDLTDQRSIENEFKSQWIAYSRPSLPLIPDEACHPFHANAATDSTVKLPPRQYA